VTIFSDPTYLQEAVVLVDEVFLTTLGLAIEPVYPPGAKAQMDYISGLDYYGDWRGSFYIGVPAGLATELARRFIPGAGPELKAEDIQDALGELANLIGGNMKALLPGAAHVTTPAPKPAARPSEGSSILEFACLGSSLWMWLDYGGKSVDVNTFHPRTDSA
jgi:hypothetical protein